MGRRGKSERNRPELRSPQQSGCRFKPGEFLNICLVRSGQATFGEGGTNGNKYEN